MLESLKFQSFYQKRYLFTIIIDESSNGNLLVILYFFLYWSLTHEFFDWLIVLQGASIAWNVPLKFVSVVLLPIVGNGTEHASAIMFAVKDKLASFLTFSSNNFFLE